MIYSIINTRKHIYILLILSLLLGIKVEGQLYILDSTKVSNLHLFVDTKDKKLEDSLIVKKTIIYISEHTVVYNADKLLGNNIQVINKKEKVQNVKDKPKSDLKKIRVSEIQKNVPEITNKVRRLSYSSKDIEGNIDSDKFILIISTREYKSFKYLCFYSNYWSFVLANIVNEIEPIFSVVILFKIAIVLFYTIRPPPLLIYLLKFLLPR